jgi:hypothetical protein
MSHFQRLQQATLIAWLVVLSLSIWVIGHMMFVQIAGQTVSGKIVAVSIWNPPGFTWSHYTCTISSNGRNYTVANSINQCLIGESATFKINPFNSNDAWYEGEFLSGRTALAYCYILLSLGFGLVGFALRITRHNSPWRSAVNWVLDQLEK